MVNRITNHCKTLRHFLLLLVCTCITSGAVAATQSVSIYLKLKPDNPVSELIKEFNQFLADQQIFTTYQITPYLGQYPLHVTLYLASYPEEQIPLIIKEAEALAKQPKKISLLTSKFILGNKAYVMLSVNNNAQIQGLSNKALRALAGLRDKKALIPDWAAQDVERKIIFNQYGSPSVLNFFNPHFSIFDADHLNKDEGARLSEQLQNLIDKFDFNHQTSVRAEVDAIGIGITDEQGQITRELQSIALGGRHQ